MFGFYVILTIVVLFIAFMGGVIGYLISKYWKNMQLMEIGNIKFKAKKTLDGKWIKGDLVHHKDSYNVWITDYENQLTSPVNPSTVCQFTGLKDTNDVPIFEGDIIAFDGEGEVVFKDGAFYAKFGKYTECLLCNLVKSGLSVTIVGNKFDKK